jgi:hypothetical protein
MGGGSSILSDLQIAWTEELQNEYELLKRDHDDWSEEQLYEYMKNKYYNGERNENSETKSDELLVSQIPVVSDDEVIGFLGLENSDAVTNTITEVPIESSRSRQRKPRPSKSSFLTSSANSNFGGDSESGLSQAAGTSIFTINTS